MIHSSLSISVVLVTSPSPSMPSTELVTRSLDSLINVKGMEYCDVIIVMDGFELCDTNRTKKGKITMKHAELYELYHQALLEQFTDSRFQIYLCDKHHGFAQAVQFGLSKCNTTYAMVMQHDRMFISPFNRLEELVCQMELHRHIRYIGFPTSSNISHDRLLASTLNLNILNSEEHKLSLGDNLYLQPLVFWFDSNHLCHVQRYLEIFRPISNLPPQLRTRIGMKDMKKMVLRKGDFIEDRFGQMQRILLSNAGAVASAGGKSEDYAYIIELFRWFGSYLCWESTSEWPFNPIYDKDRSACKVKVIVAHLRGRQLDPVRVKILRDQQAATAKSCGEDPDTDSLQSDSNISESNSCDES